MQLFFILGAVATVLICCAFSLFTKASASAKFNSIFYSVIFGIYLLLCMPIFNALLVQFQVNIPYLNVFLSVATAVSLIAPVLTLVGIIVKNNRVCNILFNSYFFLLTAAYIGLFINCLLTHKEYIFIAVFLPLHYLLSLVVAASTLQDISVKSQMIKIYVAYSLLALGCCLGIAGIIATSISTGVINGAFFVIVAVFLCIAFAGIVTTALQAKRLSSK